MSLPAEVFDDLLTALDAPAPLAPPLEQALHRARFDNRKQPAVDFACEVLADHHDRSRFDSTQQSLDSWLKTAARDSEGRNLTRTRLRAHRQPADRLILPTKRVDPYLPASS